MKQWYALYVSLYAKQKFAMHHWAATSAETWRLSEFNHGPRRQTVDPNGQGQYFHIGSSSARVDDPPISKEVVSSEQASG